MRKKFDSNGYVMPDIVCWDLSHKSEASFKIFLEGDGAFGEMAVLESKICSENYLKLVVHD
jgi:hypothetical protein